MNPMTSEESARLEPARVRVFRLLRDGKPHTTLEINDVGGTDGTRRLRELRAFGVFINELGKVSGGVHAYQLDTQTLTPEIESAILSREKPPADERSPLDQRRLDIIRLVRNATAEQLDQIEAVFDGQPDDARPDAEPAIDWGY